MKLKWYMAQTADFQIRELLYLENELIKYVLIILSTLS